MKASQILAITTKTTTVTLFFSVSTTEITFSSDVPNFDPNPIEITGSLSSGGEDVYVQIDASATNLIVNAQVFFDADEESGRLGLTPAAGADVGVGEHTGVVTVSACRDINCATHYSGSPVEITIHYDVTGPDLTVDSNSLSFTVVAGSNELPTPGVINMTSPTFVGTHGSFIPLNSTEWLQLETDWNNTQGTAEYSIIQEMPVGTYTASSELFIYGRMIYEVIDITYTVKENEFVVSDEDLDFIVSQSSADVLQKQIVVQSRSDKSIDWEAEIDVPWLSVLNGEGNTAAGDMLTLEVNSEAAYLPPGDYQGNLILRDAAGIEANRMLELSLELDAPAVTALGPYTAYIEESKEVHIIGSGFTQYDLQLMLGEQEIEDFEVVNDSEIIAEFPALEQGEYLVTIGNGSNFTLSDSYYYVVPTENFADSTVDIPWGGTQVYDERRKRIYSSGFRSSNPELQGFLLEHSYEDGAWTYRSLKIFNYKKRGRIYF